MAIAVVALIISVAVSTSFCEKERLPDASWEAREETELYAHKAPALHPTVIEVDNSMR